MEGIFRGNRPCFGRQKYLNWIFIFEIILDLFKRVFATQSCLAVCKNLISFILTWYVLYVILVFCAKIILRHTKNTILSSSIIPWRPDSLRFTVREVSIKLLEKLFTGLIQSKRSNLNLDWVFICSLPLRHSTCDDDIYPAPPCNTRT